MVGLYGFVMIATPLLGTKSPQGTIVQGSLYIHTKAGQCGHGLRPLLATGGWSGPGYHSYDVTRTCDRKKQICSMPYAVLWREKQVRMLEEASTIYSNESNV